MLQPDGTYKKKPDNLNRINIQELFIEDAKRKARTLARRESALKNKLLALIIYSLKRIDRAIRKLDGIAKNDSDFIG